ncbi:hypothetical protein EMCRGX_G011383 [Ephydatia muelleri]
MDEGAFGVIVNFPTTCSQSTLSLKEPFTLILFGGSYRASVGPGYPQIHATIIDREAPYRFQTHCLVFYFEFPGNTIGIRLGLESESETSYLCRTPLSYGTLSGEPTDVFTVATMEHLIWLADIVQLLTQ